MILEDTRPFAESAIQALREQNQLELTTLKLDTLPNFLRAVKGVTLSRADKELICEQAILVLEQFYVHLPFKRARYAVDPVQRVRLLQAQLAQNVDDLAFHTELLSIFYEMRDAHTFYGLPSPYRGAIAFLPFYVQSYVDEQNVRHFVVTNVLSGFNHPHFTPGAEITHWNGMPIERAVKRLAEEIPAGNKASKLLRGLMRLTVRSLTYMLPPDEDMVFVQYIRDRASAPGGLAGAPGEDEERVVVFPWYVVSGIVGEPMKFRAAGICEPVSDHAAARGLLWGHTEWREQNELHRQEIAALTARQKMGVAVFFASLAEVPKSLLEDETLFSKLPNVFHFQHPSGVAVQGSITPDELHDAAHDKRYGYIRIKNFGARSDTLFEEFKRILHVMNDNAPDGLIIDVRGNPGGSINGAERILQLLTPNEITPAPFHFANTPTIQDILTRISNWTADDPDEMLQIMKLRSDFADWVQDSVEAVASGKMITDGHPLTPKSVANDTGQVYQAPVALLIDSTSYSATDIFSAGFQDHGIGPIIGVDDNTGGGGASRWLHRNDLLEKLKSLPGSPLRPLPGDASIGFAILRSSRVGKYSGAQLEDVGVRRDILQRLTKKDLMDWGSDLVKFACSELAKRPVYKLKILSAEATPEGLKIEVSSTNLDRLICYIDGQPRMVLRGSATSFLVPLEEGEEHGALLSIQGHARKKGVLSLVVAARRSLETPEASPVQAAASAS